MGLSCLPPLPSNYGPQTGYYRNPCHSALYKSEQSELITIWQFDIAGVYEFLQAVIVL